MEAPHSWRLSQRLGPYLGLLIRGVAPASSASSIRFNRSPSLDDMGINPKAGMNSKPNKRGAGKGGFAVLWRAGRSCPALPDRER